MDDIIREIISKYKTNCPFEIAEAENITIIHKDLGKNTNGFFYKVLGYYYIVLHEGLSYMFQRFTIAHELGHYFYDQGSSYFMIEQNSLQITGKYERRANVFAIKLLCSNNAILPGETITEFFCRNGIPEEMHQYDYLFSALK
ncbi:ImmA/IrrE family metallo-endopeptidase [Paenibacillus larvae]